MNPKLPVRSLIGVAEVCHGCQAPLSQHRTVTVDTWGNPLRFDSKCQCYTTWLSTNATGFLRKGTELVATT